MKYPAIPVGLSWKRTVKSHDGLFTKGKTYKVLNYNAALELAQIETDLPDKPTILASAILFNAFRLIRPNIRIYDNKGATMDQITVVFMDEPERGANNYQALSMSWNAVAVCQHITAMPGRHLGKRIQFDDLHENCKQAIYNHYSENI